MQRYLSLLWLPALACSQPQGATSATPPGRAAVVPVAQEPAAPTAPPPPEWARAERCPEGTKRVGSGPPEGIEVRCEDGDGRLVGRYQLWWQNGKARVESHYLDGLEDGPFAEWDEDGSKLVEGHHDGGQRHGTWKAWDQGALVFEASYEQDVVTSFDVPAGDSSLAALATEPVAKKWWKSAAPCPGGSVLAGAAKPKDIEVFCEHELFRHGPYTSWHEELDIRDHLDYPNDFQ